MTSNQHAQMQHVKTDTDNQIFLQWRYNRKKYNIQGDIGELLGKSCEVEKMMRFLITETEMFEEI